MNDPTKQERNPVPHSYFTIAITQKKKKKKEKEKGYVYNIFVTNFKWLVVTRCY